MTRAPSLRLRLMAWLLLPLAVFTLASGYYTWRNASALADQAQDHDLLWSARILASQLHWNEGVIEASVPPVALSLFDTSQRDRVYLRIATADGHLLYGQPDLALPAPPTGRNAQHDAPIGYDTVFEGEPVRAMRVRRAMYDAGRTETVEVVVAKTTHSHATMLSELLWPAAIRQAITIGLALALVVVGLTMELRPLARLNAALAAADPQHPAPLRAPGLQHELLPMVDTINRFISRMSAYAGAQRRFIANAAHQLRTPLALQASQIEYAVYARRHKQDWQTRRADMDDLLGALGASNRHLVDLTNKLLLLAQAEDAGGSPPAAPVDLAATALRVVERLSPLADQRRIDLGYEAADAPPWVLVQPALLEALVSNLLDNALRYTQEGGRVTVRVQPEADAQVRLEVEDDGPGIAPEARERVFERFYRVAKDTEGSGLGLAIVREIATGCGARIALEHQICEGRGLRVTVVFAGVAPATASAPTLNAR